MYQGNARAPGDGKRRLSEPPGSRRTRLFASDPTFVFIRLNRLTMEPPVVTLRGRLKTPDVARPRHRSGRLGYGAHRRYYNSDLPVNTNRIARLGLLSEEGMLGRIGCSWF
ncbi:hypothetical protein MRX96_009430 [Rhipicephalus microplus]